MLPACREYQQGLGFRVQPVTTSEQQPAQYLPRRGPARLARQPELHATGFEETSDPTQVRTLTCPVYAFERNEFPAHQRRPNL